jgi:hypothetical protein
MGIADSFVKWPAVYCCVLSSLSATIVAVLSVIVQQVNSLYTSTGIGIVNQDIHQLLLCVSCQINSLVCFTIVTVSVSLCLPPVSLQQHWAHISSLWCSVVIVVVSAFMSLAGDTFAWYCFVARVVWQLVLYNTWVTLSLQLHECLIQSYTVW